MSANPRRNDSHITQQTSPTGPYKRPAALQPVVYMGPLEEIGWGFADRYRLDWMGICGSVCRNGQMMRISLRGKPLRNVATSLGLRYAPPQATCIRLRCSRSFIWARCWELLALLPVLPPAFLRVHPTFPGPNRVDPI